MPTIFYTTPSDKNKEKFIRDAYIELYSASDAPVEIDEVEFSEPQVEPALLLSQIVEFDVDYTAEIGYHRREQYLEEERYYNADLKKHLTRTVVKERVVTDWQPYRGNKKDVPAWNHEVLVDGDSVDIGDKDPEIASQYGNYRIDVKEALAGVSGVLVDEEESDLFREIDDESAARKTSSYVTTQFFHNYLNREMPGDENRNFNCDWNPTRVISAEYLMDRYKLGFDYNGHKCFVKQCASELYPNIYCSYKYVDEVATKILDDKKSETETDPSFQRNAKLYKYLTLGSLGLFLLSIALSMANSSLGTIGIIAAIALFAFTYFVFGKTMKKQGEAIEQKYDNMMKEHKDGIRNKKIEALNRRFAQMGMEPITKEELKRFFTAHKLIDHLDA